MKNEKPALNRTVTVRRLLADRATKKALGAMPN